MCLLVLLVFEYNNLEANISCGDHQRCACKTDETNTPRKDNTEDDTNGKRRKGLGDSSKRNTSKTVDLLRCMGERGHKTTRGVLVLVEVFDVLAKDRLERERAEVTR